MSAASYTWMFMASLAEYRMSSKKVMTMSWRGLARPRTAPIVMRAAAAAKSEPTMLWGGGEGGGEGKGGGREEWGGGREGW